MLTEIVSKRMEAVPKLALIQQLGIVPVGGGWAGGGWWLAGDGWVERSLADGPSA